MLTVCDRLHRPAELVAAALDRRVWLASGVAHRFLPSVLRPPPSALRSLPPCFRRVDEIRVRVLSASQVCASALRMAFHVHLAVNEAIGVIPAFPRFALLIHIGTQHPEYHNSIVVTTGTAFPNPFFCAPSSVVCRLSSWRYGAGHTIV
jgi:hypothetical protein